MKKFLMGLRVLVLVAVGAFSYSGALVSANDLGSVEASHSSARLVSEYKSAAPGDVLWLGFELDPRDGWHSYWKNYGDSGAAPLLYWSLPDGVSAGEPLYATPHRMPVGPLMNFGYEGASTLLIPINVPDDYAAASLTIELSAEWLVCEVECVPQDGVWTAEIPLDGLAYSIDSTDFFLKARSALPEIAIWSANLSVYPEQSRLHVFATKQEVAGIKGAYFFPAGEGVTNYAAAQQWVLDDSGLYIDMIRNEGALDVTTGDGVIALEFEDGSKRAVNVNAMVEVEKPVVTAIGNTPAIHASFPLWQAALFALLGGLVLNLMPCVFPVLSLKAFSFIAANSKTASERKQEGWAYTLGIWISFMVIVSALLLIKSGGTAIGWGFQLQEPAFVGSLVLVMVLVALSLSGMFNIQIGVEGAGQKLASESGNKGAFFQGVLATLVATPCTAPLMAPAIGFALTQATPIVFLIFSLLAFGLALPFLALSYSPALARMMPRPGAWMETLKQALAFPMYLTAAWLLYVFMLQSGATATLGLLVVLIMAVFGVWLWQTFKSTVGKVIAALVMLAAVAAIIVQPFGGQPIGANSVQDEAITPYNENTLSGMLEDGETVFVYFTAEWCITCKVNEQVALFTDDTQAIFAENNVRMMKGDWTNRDAEIAALLAQYGRAGVPLYLLFPKGQAEAIILPEVLTPGILKDAIEAI
jgi:thiol:disulfide interchange protein DsbD